MAKQVLCTLTAVLKTLENLTLSTTGATATLGTPLSIAPGGTLIVNAGDTLTTGGNLTIASSATGTASVGNSQGVINGDVTVQTLYSCG